MPITIDEFLEITATALSTEKNPIDKESVRECGNVLAACKKINRGSCGYWDDRFHVAMEVSIRYDVDIPDEMFEGPFEKIVDYINSNSQRDYQR